MAQHPIPTDTSPMRCHAAVTRMIGRLADVERELTDAERVDLIGSLEVLKSAAAAAQAKVTADFAASQRAAQASAGVRAAQQGRGIGSQVGLARKDSPFRGQRHLGLALTLVRELPHTLAALEQGALSEWQATLVARETAILSAADRAIVDRALCSDAAHVDRLGDREIVDEVRRLGHRLDPAAAVRRARNAASGRRVSIRPALDTMARVSALLPVAQGVALFASLKQQADRLVGQGDGRSRGQVMADTLVQRVTGQAEAEAVPVGVHLVMTATSLFGQGSTGPDTHEPARLEGYGAIPAEWARDLVRTALEQLGAKAAGWLRRVFRDPDTGELVALDARSRDFPDGLDRLLHVRDAGICRTPWCGAAIRHSDHVIGRQHGGATSAANGQGLCEQCNYAKQAPGWQAVPRPGPRHTVRTTTPTGHTYWSTAPPLPGSKQPTDLSWPEERLLRLVLTA